MTAEKFAARVALWHRIAYRSGRAPYSHGQVWIRAKWRAYALVESARAALAVEVA